MKRYEFVNKIVFLLVVVLIFAIVGLSYSNEKALQEEIEQASKIESEEQQKSFEIWTIEGTTQEIINGLIIQYKKQYPEITFKVKAFKDEIYNETLINAARTNTLPDMFYTWGNRTLQDLVSLNSARDITQQVYQHYSKQNKLNSMNDIFVPNALESYTINGQVYGLPICGWDAVVYCNKSIFDEENLSLPTTYSELLNVVHTFRDKGVVPIAMSGEEAWMSSIYFMELVLEDAEVNMVEEAIQDPEHFSSEPFVNAAIQYQQLMALNPWQFNYKEASSWEALQAFTRNEAAMMVGGSWMSTNIEKGMSARARKNIKVIPFPIDKQSGYIKGVAGYSDGFVLNDQCDLGNIDEDTLFINLTKDISDAVVVNTGMGLPVYLTQTYDPEKYSILAQCQDIFPKCVYHSAYDQLLSAEAVKQYNIVLKKFTLGDCSVDAFIAGISDTYEK